MADFTNKSSRDTSVADLAAHNPGINMGTTGSMQEMDWGSDRQWPTEDAHWREQYPSRPYARADRAYEHYQPAYRYGTSSATRHAGREWDDAERDLERDWDASRGESGSAWHDVKDAVRDAWDRVRGRGAR